MPKNLFGNMKPNALMAMLQQEQQQPAYKSANPFGQAQMQPPVQQEPAKQQSPPLWAWEPPPVPTPTDPYRGPVLPPTGFMPSRGQQKQMGGALKEAYSVLPDVASGAGKALGTGKAAELEGDKPAAVVETDPAKILMGAASGDMHEPPPDGYGNRTSALEQYIKDQFAGGNGQGPNFGGKFDLSKLGAAAAEMEKAKLARRQDFEGTPELDKLIAAKQGELEFAKGERKKPGLGEFLTLALMNLGNRDYRNNADMVLGTGEQREKERRLEDQLAGLQGHKATSQMQGRREMHSTDQQDRYRQLQMAMKKAEMSQKQSQFDKRLQFDEKKSGNDLLRMLSGQDAQTEGQTMDSKTRENASKSKNKLRSLMGLDPGGIENMIRQQQLQKQKEAEAQDKRQGRLFGDFIGGGGYA